MNTADDYIPCLCIAFFSELNLYPYPNNHILYDLTIKNDGFSYSLMILGSSFIAFSVGFGSRTVLILK